MKASTLSWTAPGDWSRGADAIAAADLVIAFGSRSSLEQTQVRQELQVLCGDIPLIGCSTGGHFLDGRLDDDRVIAMLVRFAGTTVRGVCLARADVHSDVEAGHQIAQRLMADDLAGVFILADGVSINGSRLVEGLTERLGPDIPVTGGLAGDGADFKATLVFGPGGAGYGRIAGIGFYGDKIRIGHGSFGGWQFFGPRRTITKSHDNVLFELDGKPALDLYERYLGEEEAQALPASGLFYPLQINDPNEPEHEVVRTVLAIDREKRSMTFAGDVPVGWSARLMHGMAEELKAGAGKAGMAARAMLPEGVLPEVNILVSCIGRRLLLGQNVGSEIDTAMEILGARVPTIGFYSYGEISPQSFSGRCDIHNQTMTVTTLAEVP